MLKLIEKIRSFHYISLTYFQLIKESNNFLGFKFFHCFYRFSPKIKYKKVGSNEKIPLNRKKIEGSNNELVEIL